ncbi:uracil-DNA glycosylase family protein [uncultured Campylobacter sp.]|uniref:uracil-DNA glycosylase family protein n=1 Tax=uncultured Campylobacter sp. TaxID=218934 RepID=UPI0026064120|nr:uracil-DNA glycosylase family protein [uncultured Campylobacter sp.]
MQSSQLRRLLYYKAFGYRYVSAEILSGGARFSKALDALKSATAECNLCELAKTRTSSSEQNFKNFKTIKNFKAPAGVKLMIVALAPGASEGLGGSLEAEVAAALDQICAPEEIYFSFLIRCAVPQNRRVNSEMILKCAPYLTDEIKILKPKVVLCLGELCCKIVLRNGDLAGMDVLHGSVFNEGGISFVPSFDPAFIAQNPSKAELFKEDLQKIKGLL